MKDIGKRGNILTENIVFLVITLLFISMLFVFVARASSKTSLIEEAQAKKIALLIDSARPGTEILLNVKDVLEKKGVGIEDDDVITINGNSVVVKLNENSGKSYGFFNNVNPELKIDETLEGFLKISTS